ncbi:hypothetical protein SNOG_00772 [Parastagonospora nodorum SN15]|uniref:Uncharacterized protein n=1 Tax=Phaeosphaeria nodorum (strain SN15 / ATCC MYA-4574 / FGSC 10173) TaxID=321614 RepID=Q0V5E2_PHANO|nr:hypothetical protein SNOG_00772 [Parastagonospora nodorum SN15]EAT92267.1 hypothetical protein SNOG_00772 [Parastagonospora nodorum SN15]
MLGYSMSFLAVKPPRMPAVMCTSVDSMIPSAG